MTKADFVYTLYIDTTPEAVWAALQDPEMTKLFWGRSRNVSDWTPGARWEHQNYDDAQEVDVRGTVIESEPPRRLVLSWESPHADAPPSRVTFDIRAAHGSVRLTVTHEGLSEGPVANGVAEGWAAILSSLKSLLETGKPLPATTQRWHPPTAARG